MKKQVFRFIIVALCLFAALPMTAVNPQAPPPCFGTTEDCDVPVVPGEKVPINDHLIPILLISLLFGAYMIYRYNQKQKNPV